MSYPTPYFASVCNDVTVVQNRSMPTTKPMAAVNTTRVFFVFEGGNRLMMDIDDQQTVGEIKEAVRRALRLGDDEGLTGSESHRRKILSLSYAGAILDERWRFADLGIPRGVQVRLL